ncbi:MAG: hypothetical protein IRY98_07075 [Alicyclobacillaceae bacterium]|nr:hypothetical protein [Alicyclobacillaceae bacterium]
MNGGPGAQRSAEGEDGAGALPSPPPNRGSIRMRPKKAGSTVPDAALFKGMIGGDWAASDTSHTPWG